MVDYKVYLCACGYEPEVRRMVIDNKVAHNYYYLKQKLISVFPALEEKQFTICWKDQEDDNVRIGSDEELVIALKEMEGQQKKKIYVATPSEDEEGPVHPNVFCDECESLVVGFRYKCIVCPDFDLCADCERSQNHNEHPMLRIPVPLLPEYPFSKRFERDLHKISKQIDHLLLRQERKSCENKGRGDGNCGHTSESKSGSSRRHEKKHKHCPFNAVPIELDKVFQFFRAPEFPSCEAGERPQTSTSEAGERPQPSTSEAEARPQPSDSGEATPNTSAHPTSSNMDDYKKMVEMFRHGLKTFLNPLGDDAIFHSLYENGSATPRQEPTSSAASVNEEPRPSSEQPQTAPQVPTGNDTSDAGAGSENRSPASGEREATPVLDSSWTVVNNQESQPGTSADPSPSSSSAPPTAPTEETQSPPATIYPAIPVMPINSSGEILGSCTAVHSLIASSFNLHDVIDETMQRMVAMGFTDEEGWLRQLVESKKGNIEEVLKFLTPIPKSQQQ